MSTNKVIIEIPISEFLDLRCAMASLYQIWRMIPYIVKLLTKVKSIVNHSKLNEYLCYLTDEFSGIKIEDIKGLMDLFSYSEEDKNWTPSLEDGE